MTTTTKAPKIHELARMKAAEKACVEAANLLNALAAADVVIDCDTSRAQVEKKAERLTSTLEAWRMVFTASRKASA